MWFGHQHRDDFANALAKAMHRRGVEGIRIGIARHPGGLVTVNTVKGRDKAAAKRRDRAFVAFLRIDAELRCENHAPSDVLQCDWCWCWFKDGVHAEPERCPYKGATFDGPCPVRTWDDEHTRAADAGTMPHRWRPVRCASCDVVYSNDLDDLRAQLRALDSAPASITATDAQPTTTAGGAS